MDQLRRGSNFQQSSVGVYYRIGFVVRVMRFKEWGSSKLTPLLTLGFLWILGRRPPTDDAIIKVAFLLILAVCGFTFGYLINDYFDRSSDRRAGKPNASETLSRGLVVALLIALATASGALLLWVHASPALLILAGGSYAAAVGYSAWPRFKERGTLGLAASAFAQRTMPALFALVLFADFRFQQFVLAFVYTIVGLRWILMHQLIDYQRDRLSRVHTYISDRGPQQALSLIQRVLFPLEALGLLVWFVLAARSLGGLIVVAAIYLCWVCLRRVMWRERAYSWTSYSNAYLGDLYSIFLPVSLGLMCVLAQQAYWPFLLVTLYLSLHRALGKVYGTTRFDERALEQPPPN